MDLFTTAEKLSLSNVFNDLHDTFSRLIFMYKKANEIVIYNNPEHNFLWNDAPSNSTTETTIESGSFQARILYGKDQKLENFGANTNNNAEGQNQAVLEMGMVRIKLDPTGAAFLGGAERVKFDDEIFEVTTSARPHGLFTPQFYTYYLKKLN